MALNVANRRLDFGNQGALRWIPLEQPKEDLFRGPLSIPQLTGHDAMKEWRCDSCTPGWLSCSWFGTKDSGCPASDGNGESVSPLR
jgi:hypothetical protein